jgi:hypothetical protein
MFRKRGSKEKWVLLIILTSATWNSAPVQAQPSCHLDLLILSTMSGSDDFAEVKKSGIDGRGLFAKKSLKAGELIFKKKRPLVAALDPARQYDTCASCFRSRLSELLNTDDESGDAAFDAKKCTGCHYVAYCSKVGDLFP